MQKMVAPVQLGTRDPEVLMYAGYMALTSNPAFKRPLFTLAPAGRNFLFVLCASFTVGGDSVEYSHICIH